MEAFIHFSCHILQSVLLEERALAGNSMILALPRENSLGAFWENKTFCDPVAERLQVDVKLYLPNLWGTKSFASGSHFSAIWEHALDVPLGDCTCPDWWSNVVITIDLDLTFDPWRRALKSFFISHLFWVMPLHLPLSQSFSNSPPGQMLAGYWLYMPREKYTLPNSANTPRAPLIFLKKAWESLKKGSRVVFYTSAASDENKKCSIQCKVDFRYAASQLTLRATHVNKALPCLLTHTTAVAISRYGDVYVFAHPLVDWGPSSLCLKCRR